ncbi:sensor histidine kinase [Streptomyces sp. NBC_00094]|uniref:sensor histidine kinase n=1 Tax=Streptomyces sp. NBC_00094 TaxID=2903620 RepID=UPI00225883B2|nr:sensor histidine kinase [Streptomyces sp. NBC_00094]MCX5393628.1 sensor histidine kinase [Streptomyces sp. NBC_00094]
MNDGAPIGIEETDPDAGWLATVMHVAFFVLLCSALTRYLIVHPGARATPWVIALAIALALLYFLGPTLGPGRTSAPGGSDPALGGSDAAPGGRGTAAGGRGKAAALWLTAVIGSWLTLVALAPSFGWCAVPLFYTGLRSLRTRSAIILVALITAFVVAAQVKLRLRFGFDPTLMFAPPAVAAAATAVFIYSQRQADRLRTVITDLVRTRRDLVETERREGTLAERQRLSMEIHDTLAQGLSSQQMLLQAADRLWDGDPGAARRHVRTAATIAEHNLTEARRFVHDLAPADLADGAGLDEALRTLADRETSDTLRIRFHQDGTPTAALPERVQSALLRIAQGALANVREHADAATAALTLSHLDDQVVLDIADDGRGFDPTQAPGGVRGHGLPAMRARVQQLGGVLTVESAPGEGTVLSAAIPLSPPRT